MTQGGLGTFGDQCLRVTATLLDREGSLAASDPILQFELSIKNGFT